MTDEISTVPAGLLLFDSAQLSQTRRTSATYVPTARKTLACRLCIALTAPSDAFISKASARAQRGGDQHDHQSVEERLEQLHTCR